MRTLKRASRVARPPVWLASILLVALTLDLGGRACAVAKSVEVSPLHDWVILPSLTAGNGEIITAGGALFSPLSGDQERRR